MLDEQMFMLNTVYLKYRLPDTITKHKFWFLLLYRCNDCKLGNFNVMIRLGENPAQHKMLLLHFCLYIGFAKAREEPLKKLASTLDDLVCTFLNKCFLEEVDSSSSTQTYQISHRKFTQIHQN